MKIEHYHNGIRYTLSNENLEEGNPVFPIASGRVLDDGSWILHEFKFENYCTGFPDEPHIIKNLHYSDSKPEEVLTNMGYGPVETYYKIIKKEVKVKNPDGKFPYHIWQEFD